MSTDQVYKNAILDSFLQNLVLPINFTGRKESQKYLGVDRWRFKQPPRLGDAKIESFLQWSFPKPVKEDVFKSQDIINTLDCRSGLVDNSSSMRATKIIFVHKLQKEYNPCKPTCFDAEFYPQFLPGGTTKPLNKCKDQDGFDEFIHKANKFKNLSAEFYEIYKN